MKFKHKFWVAFIWMTSGTFILSILTVQIYFYSLHIGLINSQWLLTIGIFSIIWCLFWGLIIHYFVKITVNDIGLHCYNFWCIYSTVPWETITSCEPINFLGMPYIRVFSTKTRLPLWLPLFIHNYSSFVQQTKELAGSNNALTQSLNNA